MVRRAGTTRRGYCGDWLRSCRAAADRMAEEVDEEHLELVEMRLDIDVESLRAYLVANSDFPDGLVQIKQLTRDRATRRTCSQPPTATATWSASNRRVTCLLGHTTWGENTPCSTH